MKLKEKTADDKGRTVLVCEDRVLWFWRRERRFLAQSKLASNYWSWLELPGKNLVDGVTSLQLDAWNRE